MRRAGSRVQSQLQRDLGSLTSALAAEYPDHPWLPWRFARVPQGFWKQLGNRKHFCDVLARERQHTTMQDWYSVTLADFASHGGRSMLRHYYHDSPAEAIMFIYDSHTWLPWRFQQAPRSCWSSSAAQLQFIRFAAEKLGIQHNDGWQKITASDIRNLGGGGLLDRYNGSVQQLLSATLHTQQSYLGPQKASQGFWNHDTNVIGAVKELEAALNIQQPADWYRIPGQKIRALGGTSLLQKYGSLESLLRHAYPSHLWDSILFSAGSSD